MRRLNVVSRTRSGAIAALAYDRSDRLDLRRPVMERWSQFVIPPPSDNVIELRRAGT